MSFTLETVESPCEASIVLPIVKLLAVQPMLFFVSAKLLLKESGEIQYLSSGFPLSLERQACE